MLENILQEPILTHEYYNEYLNTIKRYENVTRSSIFIRYLNINKKISVYSDDTSGTIDKFDSGIFFDSYDYTPVIQFDPNVNVAADRNDLTGFKFDGLTSIVIYTISEPNIGDLVLFPYSPYRSEAILRVNSISTSLEVRNNSLFTYKLGLEYAPLKNIENLKIANKYAYLLSEERNLLVDQYIQKINNIKRISEELNYLQSYFNTKYELYYYTIDSYVICPINTNKLIYRYICNEKYINRYYDRFKKPFGVIDYPDNDVNLGFDIINNRKIRVDEFDIPYIDLNNNLIDEQYIGQYTTLEHSNIELLNIALLMTSL